MAISKITPTQAASFIALRSLSAETAKPLRKMMWAAIKQQHGIPADHTLRVEADDVDAGDYLVIKRKSTGNPYEGGGEVVPVQAPRTAWFQLDLESAVLEVEGTEVWEDGQNDPAPDTEPTVIDGYKIKLTADGVYVEMDEASM